MRLREKIFEEVQRDEDLRRSLVPYLTDDKDPYFDTFLAVACYYLSEHEIKRVFHENGDKDKLRKFMGKATICEIGKGPSSRAFRLFGKDYLAVTEPEINPYPAARPVSHYEGTVREERIIDLRFFTDHSLNGNEFDVTLSHGLLGDISATGLVAGKPSNRHMELRENEQYKRFHTTCSIRNMLAVFSNITSEGGLSVHRCDRKFIKSLNAEGYIKLLGFNMESLLHPAIKGGFIKEETIAVLKKTHRPKDGIHHVFVAASEILKIDHGKCGIKEVTDRFSDALRPEVSINLLT